MKSSIDKWKASLKVYSINSKKDKINHGLYSQEYKKNIPCHENPEHIYNN